MGRSFGYGSWVGEGLLFFVLFLWSVEFVFKVFQPLIIGAGLLVFLPLLFVSRVDRGELAIFLAGFIMLLGATLSVFNGTFAKMNFIWIPAHMVLALFFIRYRRGNIAAKVVYVLFSAYVLASIYFGRISPNEILVGSSRNGLSVFTVSMVVLIAAIEHSNGQRLSLWPSILGLWISVIGEGRSGIGVSIGLLVVAVASRFRRWGWPRFNPSALGHFRTRTFLMPLLASLLLVVALALVLDSMGMVRLEDIRFVREGLDTPRWEIWKGYISELGFADVLAGKRLRDIEWMERWGYNPHNAFLLGHAKLGMMFLLLFGWVVITWFASIKVDPILASMFMLLGVRATFDIVFFFGIFDFVWMFYFALMTNGLFRRKRIV